MIKKYKSSTVILKKLGRHIKVSRLREIEEKRSVAEKSSKFSVVNLRKRGYPKMLDIKSEQK